jgi:two-component system sensor histidine kinase UhpB
MARLAAAAAPSSLSLGLVLFAGGFAAQAASALVGDQEAGPIVWLPGGVLLTALMSFPEKRWPSCVAGLVAGVALATALPEGSMLASGWPLLLVLVLIPAGAYAMRVFCAETSPLRTFRNLGLFLAVFAFALPAIASVASILAGRADPNQHPQWLQIGLAHALGYLVFAPIWFRPRARWATLQRMFVPDSLPAISAVAAIAVIGFLWSAFGSFSHLRPLLVLAPIPVLVFTALRARVAGAYFVVVLIAIVAIQVSREGRGPFVEPTPSLTTLSLTSWILATGVASWLLSVLIEQRVDMRRALVHTSREVRELAGRLLEAQEQERSRIARDLHDDVNQRLASVSIELSAIRRGADERSRDELAHVQDELIALSEDVRHLSHNLHPSMLHETGLEAALGSLCHAQRHRNGPSIDLFVMPGSEDLPDAVALCLYRCAQEALANAIRHAMARRIEVGLGIVDGQAELKVEDDGKGFETARPRGLGLLSLEERAKLLGGGFQLTTSPGKGTRICIRIPLQSHRPR